MRVFSNLRSTYTTLQNAFGYFIQAQCACMYKHTSIVLQHFFYKYMNIRYNKTKYMYYMLQKIIEDVVRVSDVKCIECIHKEGPCSKSPWLSPIFAIALLPTPKTSIQSSNFTVGSIFEDMA